MNDHKICFDGLDATTGEPLYPSLALPDAFRIARGVPPDAKLAAAAEAWRRRQEGGHLGTRHGVDPCDLASAGWGVIFPRDGDPAVREALGELLEHRRRQAGAQDERRFRVLHGDDGWQPGETWRDFRNRHGVGPDQADPAKLPYYLLLIGNPEEIPWSFQTALDVQYAVGRLAFDTPEEYARYACSVVAAETGAPPRPRRAAFFGVRHATDRVTVLTADYLIPGIAGFLAEGRTDWTIDVVPPKDATRARLATLLGAEAPALLFTATHGMGFPDGYVLQRDHQGALLCQDWSGEKGPVGRDAWFAAEDLEPAAGPSGTIALHFACHGAGTPRLEAYPSAAGAPPRELAPQSFVARLPQRLLSHPRGGALAVVGHVERAWCHSFLWNSAVECQVFQDALARLLDGQPVGAAMEPFGLRYASLAAELKEEQERLGFGKVGADESFLRLWTAANDARNYIILGDPAVRLSTSPLPGLA